MVQFEILHASCFVHWKLPLNLKGKEGLFKSLNVAIEFVLYRKVLSTVVWFEKKNYSLQRSIMQISCLYDLNDIASFFVV